MFIHFQWNSCPSFPAVLVGLYHCFENQGVEGVTRKGCVLSVHKSLVHLTLEWLTSSSTVVRVSSHSRWAFAWSPCACMGFLAQSQDMHFRWNGLSTLTVGVVVSLCSGFKCPGKKINNATLSFSYCTLLQQLFLAFVCSALFKMTNVCVWSFLSDDVARCHQCTLAGWKMSQHLRHLNKW